MSFFRDENGWHHERIGITGVVAAAGLTWLAIGIGSLVGHIVGPDDDDGRSANAVDVSTLLSPSPSDGTVGGVAGLLPATSPSPSSSTSPLPSVTAHLTHKPTTAQTHKTSPTPHHTTTHPTVKHTATHSSSSTYYVNCSAVRAAGKDPLYRGEPGYSRKLDRDGDGVACE